MTSVTPRGSGLSHAEILTSFRAFAGFFMLVVAALCLWIANGDQRLHRAINTAGVMAEAHVLARRIDLRGDWWLAYTFRLPDGAAVVGQGPAARVVEIGGNADPYRRGAVVQVRYLRADPAINQPLGAPEPGRAVVWVGIGTVSGIVGLSLLSLAFGEAHKPARKPTATDRPAPPRGLSVGPILRFWALWGCVAFALASAGGWWLAQAGPRADRAFWDAAVAQQTAEGLGTVTNRSLGGRITGRHLQTGQLTRTLVFFVDYSFEGPDGILRLGQSRVSGVEYDRFLPGSRVLVRIVRDDPDKHALALAAPRLDDWRLRSLSITFGFIALGFAMAAAMELTSKWRAARSGLVRDVTVTGHRPALAGLMSFDWVDADGNSGISPGLRSGRLPPVGATLVLRVDPEGGYTWWEDLL